MALVEATIDRGFSTNGAHPAKSEYGLTWQGNPPDIAPTTFAQLLRQRVRGFFPPDAEGQVTRELTKRGARFQPLAEYNRHKLMVRFKLNAGQIDELSQAIGLTWRKGDVVGLEEALSITGLVKLKKIVSNPGKQRLAEKPVKAAVEADEEAYEEEAYKEEAGEDANLEVNALADEPEGDTDDPTKIYLHEIGRTKLLTADDEKRLGRQREEARFIQRLEESKYPERSVAPA